MSEQQQALAASAVLRGSCTVKEFSFPLTGDTNADFISGIQALCVALDISFEMSSLALEYMAKVKRAKHEQVMKLQQMPPAFPSVPAPVGTNWPWDSDTTASGTASAIQARANEIAAARDRALINSFVK